MLSNYYCKRIKLAFIHQKYKLYHTIARNGGFSRTFIIVPCFIWHQFSYNNHVTKHKFYRCLKCKSQFSPEMWRLKQTKLVWQEEEYNIYPEFEKMVWLSHKNVIPMHKKKYILFMYKYTALPQFILKANAHTNLHNNSSMKCTSCITQKF